MQLPWVACRVVTFQTNLPTLFYKVFEESSILGPGMKMDGEFIKNAKISFSAKKMFYDSNSDKALTAMRILETVKEMERKTQKTIVSEMG